MKLLLSLLLTLNCFGISLKFHKQIIMPHAQILNDTVVGGLSGIRYEESTKTIYAISDDRSRKSPARFYTFKVKEEDTGLNILLNDVVILKNAKGKNFKKGRVDFEDIEIKGNDLYITSEGNLRGRFIQPPRVVVFKKDGTYKSDLQVDNKFKPIRDNGHFVSGIRSNLAFEPLAFTKNKQYLFTATEDALRQDGPTASTKVFSKVRVIKYSNNGSGYIPNEEYVYPLGPVATVTSAALSLGAQAGLPAMLALSENELLILERTYYPLQDITTVLLFNAKIEKRTTNVVSVKSLKDKKINLLKKDFILNLDQYLGQFDSKYQALDNIEGMCFGPKLKNGNETLIFVSDNNFSKGQKTQFLIFEIIKEGRL